MPHVFGRDPDLDSRWLGFLQTTQLARSTRATLLDRGWDPSQSLPEGLSESSLAVSSKRWRPAFNHPISLITRGESCYPPALKLVGDAPPALFVQGDVAVLSQPHIAIVGTRQPSVSGLRIARQLAGELCQAGFVVVSGLARGIDGEAHTGALDVGGSTVAVMATGMDRVYPSQHRVLAGNILESGALVSEFLPGVQPSRWHFPRRNRTIAGLALATVVVEAGRPSGSLLTAAAAADQGRDVFAFPWSVHHKGGEGCLYLLGDGAHLARDTRDVVAQLAEGLRGFWSLPGSDERDPVGRAVSPSSLAIARRESPLDPLLSLMGDGEVSLEELERLSGSEAGELRRRLSALELAGKVSASALGYRAI